MTKISVIIQSRGSDIVNMRRSVSCFLKQTHKEKELILMIDQIFTDSLYQDWLNNVFGSKSHENIRVFSNLNSKFAHNNVSSMRNFGAKQARGEYILFMDDDEDIHADYLTKTMEYRRKLKKTLGKDFVLTPTLMYRHTGEIQNQGFSYFNYRLSRPIGCVLGQREYARIQMYSGNSLFAPAYIFQENPMDERFDFIYEDLAYTQYLHSINYPIIVTKHIKIYHMERDKTKLDHAWVGNIYQAYRKSKHRILFIRKFATGRQLFQFYILGFLGQPLRLTLKVMLYRAPNKLSIIKNIWKGTIDGLRG
ncbi:MAG: glycosyltransferase [Candidatus Absconditabacteria bacterium]|nr:glycosyltransferase [Candidatus Absconditabacteria bacterium]